MTAKFDAENNQFIRESGTNESILSSTKVSWTENEEGAKTIDVPLPDTLVENVVVSVKNGSAVSILNMTLSNFRAFSGTSEASALTTVSIPVSSAQEKVITGFPRGEKGRVTLTKETTTAPAFDAWVIVSTL